MRDRPPELRHVRVVHQSGARAARAARQRREVRQVRDDAAEGTGRGSGAAAPRAPWGEADEADARAGRLHRRAGGRPVQAESLSVLSGKAEKWKKRRSKLKGPLLRRRVGS